GETDGDRIERHGPRREPRRREADRRLVRESARPRHPGSMISKSRRTAAVMLLAACALAAAPPPAAQGEAATATYFASIRNNPSLLLAFLAEMPKGGDLHNHLSGAIYAE